MSGNKIFSLMNGSDSVISSKIIENNSERLKESTISLGNSGCAFVNKKSD